jgi:hypothetical protein
MQTVTEQGGLVRQVEQIEQTELIDREQADVLAGRICAAAGLAAQTEAVLLELIGEFDAVGGIRWWNDVKSLAHWLSWCCSMAPGTAREHVRVARGLRQMPTVAAAFREGRLSYSKVREATRVAGRVDEAELCAFALTATASQLARTVRGYRTAAGIRIRQQPARALTWTEREDEMVDLRVKLPKEEAAILIAALTAAKDQFGTPPPAPEPGRRQVEAVTPSYGYADAVLDVARSFLAAAPEDRSGEDRTVVVVHVAAEQLIGGSAAGAAPAETVPAGTPAAAAQTCHLQGLGGIEPETARRLACDAELIGAVVAPDGDVLRLGRTRRLVTRAQRRALMVRDGGCQFPGCHQTRHLKAHHRVAWADGGPTDLENLILLCQWHHTAVHEGRIRIDPRAEPTTARRFDFVLPDGRPADGWRDEEQLARRLGDLVGRRRYLHERHQDERYPDEPHPDGNHLDEVDSFFHPDAQRIVPGWTGEPFGLHDCVAALFGMSVAGADAEAA